MTLERFLEQLVCLFDRYSVSHCVLRNYKGLPYNNYGNDIDFLIGSTDTKVVRKILSELDGVTVTGYLERPYVISVYLHGIEWGEKRKGIEIDFVLSLSWKGLSYIDVSEVLNSALPGKDCAQWIRAPSKEHEAIISFFSSYLIGGWIKDRYQKFVRSVFETNRDEVEKILNIAVGPRSSRAIVEAVILDDRKRLISILPQLRRQLLFRSFYRAPLHSAGRVIEHYTAEILIRFANPQISSVCILGPDGSGKSSVLQKMEKELSDVVKEICPIHLKPRFFFKRTTQGPVIDPHGKQPRSVFPSIIKIWIWAIELFIDRVTHRARNVTLRLWDRYYHDLLVDPRRYRYGGPMWLVRWVGWLIPKPGLWILLDAPPEVLQERKQEVSFKETDRQRKEYLKLINEMENGVVVDASKSLDKVVDDVNTIIVKYLAQRTEKSWTID
jgi:thymidylate kinase